MKFSLARKGNYFFVKDGMFLREPEPWDPYNLGEGDAIGRTAIGYIITKSTILRSGIMDCFRMKLTESGKPYLQARRYPTDFDSEYTMSRDHIAYALIALLETGEKDRAKFISSNIRWKISELHSQTIDFWLWHKAATSENIFLTLLWHIFLIPQILLILPINKIGRGIAKLLNKQWPTKICFPTYAFFILAWQLRLTRETFVRPLVEYLARFEVEKDNLVLQMLLRKRVDYEDIFKYKSRRGIRWSRRMDTPNKNEMRLATEDEVVVNDLDRGLLFYLYKNR